MSTTLSIRGLRTALRGPGGTRIVLHDVCLDLREGETVGLVGESGCGKTIFCMSVFGGVRPFPGVVAGEVRLRTRGGEVELTRGLVEIIPPSLAVDPGRIPDRLASRFKRVHARNVAPVRGLVMAYLHQNSPQALDPLERVGDAVARNHMRADRAITREESRRRVLQAFESLALRDPERVARLFPHELSVGMSKRVALAQVLALRPSVLFVDEPTTGLDLVIQGEVIDLFREVREESGMSVVFVSHEIDLLSHVADRVVVLRDGLVADDGPWGRFFGPAPEASEYSRALLGASR